MLSFHPGLTGNYNNLLNPQKHLLQVRQDSVVTMILCVHVHAQLLSHVWLWPHGLLPIRLLCQWNFPSKNTGASCNFLLQGIFPTQGSSPRLLHLTYWQTDFYYCATWEATMKSVGLNLQEHWSRLPFPSPILGNKHHNLKIMYQSNKKSPDTFLKNILN